MFQIGDRVSYPDGYVVSDAEIFDAMPRILGTVIAKYLGRELNLWTIRRDDGKSGGDERNGGWVCEEKFMRMVEPIEIPAPSFFD